MTRHLKRIILAFMIAFIMLFIIACEQNTISDVVPDNTAVPTIPVAQQIIPVVTDEPINNEKLAEMNSVLRRATYLEGTKVEGIDIGGKTISEAKALLEEPINQKKSSFSVILVNGEDKFLLTQDKIPLFDNLEDVLNEAFNLVREDKGYDSVMQEVREIKEKGIDFDVQLEFEPITLKLVIDEYGNAVDVKPKNASVGYDSDLNEIAFVPDESGKILDRESMLSSVKSAKNGDEINAEFIATPAEIKLADIESKYVLRGKMTTNYSKSISNRKYNIKKGAGKITGTILHPGEVFSANGTLGVRNKANGWKVATAYVAGAHEKQYGGGVCQLSSTLYNAAVKADMKIVDRRNHSMPVDYVSKGLDATINSVGNIIDFKFQNSSKSDIIIIAKADGANLTMEIWGIPIIEDSEGKYDEIRIPTPEKIKTLNPSGDVEYRVDESKKPGYKEQIVKNQKGSVWQSYVEYYLNGELVERKKLDQSTYKAFSAVYIVGPDKDAEATPDPTPTDKVEETSKPTPSDTGSGDPTDTPTNPPTPTDTPTPEPTPTDKVDETSKPTPSDTGSGDPTDTPTQPENSGSEE